MSAALDLRRPIADDAGWSVDARALVSLGGRFRLHVDGDYLPEEHRSLAAAEMHAAQLFGLRPEARIRIEWSPT